MFYLENQSRRKIFKHLLLNSLNRKYVDNFIKRVKLNLIIYINNQLPMKIMHMIY